MNFFSWPSFPNTTGYTTVSYNLVVSRQSGAGAPQPTGSYTTLASGVTSNLNYYDASGKSNDLYRVTPVINIIGGPSGVVFDTAISRPFFATQPLYDIQISALLDAFRMSYVRDQGIPLTDSTIPTESTGTNAMPFMTDSVTTRFFLSFLQNDDPIKVQSSSVLIYEGATKPGTLLTPYVDYYVSENGGYIDFAVAPTSTNYLQVQYNKVKYTDDELRNILINSISNLSLYGLTGKTGYGITQSNNLLQLITPLPDRDLGEILMLISAKKLVQQEITQGLEAAESWKDGKGVEWSADPGRAFTSGQAMAEQFEYEIINKCRNYIYNTRNYYNYGEFSSFFFYEWNFASLCAPRRRLQYWRFYRMVAIGFNRFILDKRQNLWYN